MNIRKLRSSEREWIKEFIYLSLYVKGGEAPFERSVLDLPEIRRYYENFDLDKNLCLICEEDHQCVGMILGHFWTGAEKGYGYFKDNYAELSLSVLPQYRSRKIGSALLAEFIKHAKILKFSGLSLSVSYGNFAINLYRRAGFQIIEERETDIIMVLHFT